MRQSTNGRAFRGAGFFGAVAIAALAVFSAPVAEARGGHGGGGGAHGGGFSGHGFSGGGHGYYGGGHGSHGRNVGGWHGGRRVGAGGHGWGYGLGGYYPYWGWPYYSTWWGGPSYYGYYAPGGNAIVETDADDGWSDRGAGTGESRTDVRSESAPRASSLARLKLSVSPADAVVYLDDKYLGAGDDLAAYPRGVVTEPGTHTITVARPGFRDKTITVTARAGSPIDVVVDLDR